MNIACVDSPYARQLEELGHKVFTPAFSPGVIYLPGVFQLNNFKPDLVIQHERLGPRVILGGLEKISCPTVFVSVDTHLNMFWHKYYGRLFDLVLTPHVSIFEALSLAERLPQVQRFGPAGHKRPFRLFKDRLHELSFTGILDEHRPARRAMVEMLKKHYHLSVPDRLPHSEMLDLFMASRMIPNESIASEVNFRLFEGASCGALLFSQNIGEDQNVYFEPGLEFETYEHALDLLDKIRFYKNNSAAAEKLGHAAWKRVQAEHLPEHRAAQLVHTAGSSRHRAEGKEANICFWLVLAQLARHGTHPLPVDWFMAQYAPEESSLIAAMKLRLWLEGSHAKNHLYNPAQAEHYREAAASVIKHTLAEAVYADSLDFNLAGAMASLALGESSWARLFLQRQQENMRQIAAEAEVFCSDGLDSPYANYVFWAKLLMEFGYDAQVGFNFRTGLGLLPASAFECLIMAKEAAQPEQDSWLWPLHEVCSRVPGFSYLDMGLLAQISLKEQNNWRYQMEYGLSSLFNYRDEAGLFEIATARNLAKATGETAAYNVMLEGMPASGYILKALNKG